MGKPPLESDRERGSARLRRAAKLALVAIVPVAAAFAIESAFWPAVPRTLLFNAAVIVSSWAGGLESGIAATLMSTGIVWYQMQGQPGAAPSAYRISVTAGFFLAIGIAISVFHARLRRANRDAADGLARSQRAMADLTRARSELEAANHRLQLTTQDLNESKGLLQAVFDHSPNAIVVKSLDGKFLLTNRQFQQFLGFSDEELRGLTDENVLTPEAAERHRQVDEAAIKSGGPVTTEESGEVRGVRLSFLETAFPLRNATGDTFGICWIGTEISEIKRAEEALAQTAADLKEAQRVAHIGSWIWDLRTDEVKWSEELFRIYGLDPSRPPPGYRGEFQQLLTSDSMEAVDAALEQLRTDLLPFELELETVLPDKTTRWISVRGEPATDASGELLAIRGTAQDITQLKHLQRMKEEWMSVVAHDLRQPIGVIKMSAELLPDLHPGKISREEGVITERISSAAKGLARMVDDLLDMSRIEAHRLSLERVWVDPRAMVRQAVAGLSHVTGDSPVIVSDPGNVSQVFVDLVRFEQIFGNLISNAVKHGERGSAIEVGIAQRGGDVQISVSNHGKGIAPEDVPRLFSRFGRSSPAHGRAAPGLGLGLYIAKGLVEAHGGRMWVESVPGKTTTFYFTLPSRVPAKEAA
jgi:PAS domain S-box-containing protein